MSNLSEVRWITDWLPPEGLQVLICWEKNGEKTVEPAVLAPGGYWETADSNVVDINCWALMPLPPWEED